MVDLRGVRSRGDLCSTSFTLADPADGDFVVHAPRGGALTLDLSGAVGERLVARWVDREAGAVSEAGAVESGNAALVLRPAERAPG